MGTIKGAFVLRSSSGIWSRKVKSGSPLLSNARSCGQLGMLFARIRAGKKIVQDKERLITKNRVTQNLWKERNSLDPGSDLAIDGDLDVGAGEARDRDEGHVRLEVVTGTLEERRQLADNLVVPVRVVVRTQFSTILLGAGTRWNKTGAERKKEREKAETHLSLSQFTVGSSILLTTTTSFCTPAVLTSIACSRV